MNWIRENKPYIEMETTALEKYVKFILSDDHNINIPPMSKSQLKRIKSNLNQAWFKNIMMKRKVAAIDKDVLENHRQAKTKILVQNDILDIMKMNSYLSLITGLP